MSVVAPSHVTVAFRRRMTRARAMCGFTSLLSTASPVFDRDEKEDVIWE
jgi:hypothetical protein